MSQQGGAARMKLVDGAGSEFQSLGLVIKVRLGDDVRRIPVLNEDMTYDELVLMMQRVYRGKLSNTDEVTIKYIDEDGDLVTIADCSDLSFAVHNCRGLLHLKLLVNGQPRLPRETAEVRTVRDQLLALRDEVECLLTKLDLATQVTTTGPPLRRTELESGHVNAAPNADGAAAKAAAATAILSPTSGREFDPLSANQHRSSFDDGAQQNVLSSFGLSAADGAQGLRSGTPDSVNSVGSGQASRAQYHYPAQTDYQPEQMPQGYMQAPYHHDQAQAASAGYPGAHNPAAVGYGNVGPGSGVYVGHQGVTQQDQKPAAQVYAPQQPQQYPHQQMQQQYGQPGAPPNVANPYAARGSPYGVHYPHPHGQFPPSS